MNWIMVITCEHIKQNIKEKQVALLDCGILKISANSMFMSDVTRILIMALECMLHPT